MQGQGQGSSGMAVNSRAPHICPGGKLRLNVRYHRGSKTPCAVVTVTVTCVQVDLHCNAHRRAIYASFLSVLP
jgi:hypothetical protein